MNDDGEAPLTEPLIVPCLYVTGCSVEHNDGATNVIGWFDVPKLGDDPGERRIVMRVSLTEAAARDLLSQLRRSFRSTH